VDYQSALTRGMSVIGSDGEEIGKVKHLRTDDFLVDRRFDRDVFVPFTAIKDVSDGRVQLTVESKQAGKMGWENPPLAFSSRP
jgi:hypothetical protein